MLQGLTESRLAHSLLMSFESSEDPNVTVFYETYQTFFSPAKVKPVAQYDVNGVPTIVILNRKQAIEYLKEVHEFYTKDQLESIIQEVAKDLQ